MPDRDLVDPRKAANTATAPPGEQVVVGAGVVATVKPPTARASREPSGRDGAAGDSLFADDGDGEPGSPTVEDQLGIDSCAREQIQFLGAVQSFGCLLVLSNDWIVQNASANSGEILGIEAAKLVATRLIEHLPPDAMHTLRGKVQMLGRGDEAVRIFATDLFGDGRLFDIALHRGGDVFLFDFERARANHRRHDASVTTALLARIQKAPDVAAMCDIAANGIWAMTGFDRVMIYRFEPDFSGLVIAEALGAGVNSYMGHRFPASDIPAQARALYTRSLQRIIADVDAPTHRLVPDHAITGKPVDLSLSVTRAVSPIHLQYLRNMGVAASMSISILRDGMLWGMVACHHPRPLYVDYEVRSALELFCRLLSYEIALSETAELTAQTDRAHELHERVSMLGATGLDAQADLDDLIDGMTGVIEFDGLAMFSEGGYRAQGIAPTEAEFIALGRSLARSGEGKAYATDHLEAAFPGIVPAERQIGGLLAIPIRRHPAEYVLLLRREATRDLRWAGPPAKTLEADGRLSPRQSFATWREEVHGHCRPWSAGDLRSAEAVRVTLLEMVLKQTSDSSNRDQRRNQQQEVLIAELNHRLRNLFGLVSGLIGRGLAAGDDPAPVAGAAVDAGPPPAASTDSVAQFATELRARVASLARAHDMLTDAADQAQTLRGAILAEARAYGEDAARICFSGGDAVMQRSGRTTMALVLHELVTNAAKYGALSVPGGEVELHLAELAGGAVAMTWTERGGPPVRAPSRSGFGSTLLNRAVPHELGGAAEIRFEPAGVTAKFTLPAKHVAQFVERPEPLPDVGGSDNEVCVETGSGGPAIAAGPDDAARSGRKIGCALVVEDNLLIAMNAADALRALGAGDVAIVGSVEAALERIEAGGIDVAILDLDLGGVLSTPVAEALRTAGVPFLLATGYDAGAGDEPAAFRDVMRLRKPYSNDAIAGALSSTGVLTRDG